jgi:hypothetical protein
MADAERADLGDADLGEVLDILRAAHPDHTIDGSQEVLPPPYKRILRLWGVTQAEADAALSGYAPTLVASDYPWKTISKPADENRFTNTLADDDTLVLATTAGVTYRINLTVFYWGYTTPGFKYRVTHSQLPSVKRSILRGGPSAAPAHSAVIGGFDAAAGISLTGTSGHGWIEEKIVLYPAASDGLFQFMWAQVNTDAVNPAILIKGSTLEWMAL